MENKLTNAKALLVEIINFLHKDNAITEDDMVGAAWNYEGWTLPALMSEYKTRSGATIFTVWILAEFCPAEFVAYYDGQLPPSGHPFQYHELMPLIPKVTLIPPPKHVYQEWYRHPWFYKGRATLGDMPEDVVITDEMWK